MVCGWRTTCCLPTPAHPSGYRLEFGRLGTDSQSFAGNMVSVKFTAEQHEGIMWAHRVSIPLIKKKKKKKRHISKCLLKLLESRGEGAWVASLGRFTLWSRWSKHWDHGTNKNITQTRTATANIHSLLVDVSCDSRVVDSRNDNLAQINSNSKNK